MATCTKTARTLQASASNGAGATTNSSTWDLRTAFGGTLQGRITNGGTGPTVGCSMVTEISTDGSAWRTYATQTAPTTNSAVTDFEVILPRDVLYARATFTGNTGQAVTVEAYGHELTSIA